MFAFGPVLCLVINRISLSLVLEENEEVKTAISLSNCAIGSSLPFFLKIQFFTSMFNGTEKAKLILFEF